MSKKTNRIKKRNRTVKRRRTVKRSRNKRRNRRTVKKLSNKGVVPLFTAPEKMHSQSIVVNQYKQSGNMIPGLRNM